MNKIYIGIATVAVVLTTIWALVTPIQPSDSISNQPSVEVEPDNVSVASAPSRLYVLEPAAQLVTDDPIQESVRPRLVSEECTIQYVYEPDGTAKQAYQCPEIIEERIYGDYPTESLKSMAYGDAEAAIELGRRALDSDPDSSSDWMIRASGLQGGSLEPLAWLVNNAYSLTSENGELNHKNVTRRYVLQRAMLRLGGPSNDMVATHILLLENGYTKEQFRSLDALSDRVVKRIAEVTYSIGDGSEGGENDA